MSRSIVLGIDPGKSGGIAVLVRGKLNHTIPMPVVAKTHGKGKQINTNQVAAILRRYRAADGCVMLERVNAMPRQGVTSSFDFGRSLGVLEGIISAYSMPLMWVLPQQWKKHHGLLKKDKAASRTLAAELWPAHAEVFARPKGEGEAEAALIAAYAWEKLK